MLKAVKTDKWPTIFSEPGVITPITEYKMAEECFVTDAQDVSALIGCTFESYPDYDEVDVRIMPEGNGWMITVLPISQVRKVAESDSLYTVDEFERVLALLREKNWPTVMAAYRTGRVKSADGRPLLSD